MSDEQAAKLELGKLTRREFRERMQSGELKACLLPIGATEQHLEHLAMEHDWRSTTLIARRVAERFTPNVLTASACAVGISEHHMSHPGTLTLRPGTFLAVLADLIQSLVRAGFKNIIVLNGHGGNIDPVTAVWDQFLREFRVNLQFLSYWTVLNDDDAREFLTGGPDALPGHAQEFETSFAFAEFPENVRTDAISDQSDRQPALANAEKGEALIARIVDRVSDRVSAMIDGTLIAEIPPYFP